VQSTAFILIFNLLMASQVLGNIVASAKSGYEEISENLKGSASNRKHIPADYCSCANFGCTNCNFYM